MRDGAGGSGCVVVARGVVLERADVGGDDAGSTRKEKKSRGKKVFFFF